MLFAVCYMLCKPVDASLQLLNESRLVVGSSFLETLGT